MKLQRVNIAIARIKGLDEKPYYFSAKCFFAWDIKFIDTTFIFFEQLPYIYLGETEELANQAWGRIRNNFGEARIYDEDKVPVLFEDNGKILAIGSSGCSAWIDVRDRFNVKDFEELGITFSDLKVWT